MEIFQIVCSDHGMETIRRIVDIGEELVAAGLKESADSCDVVVAPQGFSALIHFSTQAQERVVDVAQWLFDQDFTGDILAGERLAASGLPVDESLKLAVLMRYDSGANDFGVEGFCDATANPVSIGTIQGCGQHGGWSPHEKRAFLFLQSPETAPGEQDRPVCLLDIAPTVLRHLRLPCDDMDGKPLQG